MSGAGFPATTLFGSLADTVDFFANVPAPGLEVERPGATTNDRGSVVSGMPTTRHFFPAVWLPAAAFREQLHDTGARFEADFAGFVKGSAGDMRPGDDETGVAADVIIVDGERHRVVHVDNWSPAGVLAYYAKRIEVDR